MSTRPSLPDGLRIYAIGDIHGRYDLLQALEWDRFPLEPDDEQGPDFLSKRDDA